MENENKRLFEWLNPDGCWHDIQSEVHNAGRIRRCQKCTTTEFEDNYNPQYHTESGFFALLSGLRAKGFEITLEVEPGQPEFARLYSPRKQDSGEPWTYTGEGLTLPIALFQAAIKAMTSEEKAD